jgi:DNA adenine methylase
LDTAKLLKTLPKKLPEKSLIYLDTPYYIKGQGLYRNFYEHKDHVEIRSLLDKIEDIPWLVSYDNADEIGSIYTGYRKQVFDLQYSAQTKRVASEVMIYSNGLNIPDVHLGKKTA